MDLFLFFDVWIKMIKMIKVRLPGIWLWSFQRFQRFQVQGVQGPDLPVRAWEAWGPGRCWFHVRSQLKARKWRWRQRKLRKPKETREIRQRPKSPKISWKAKLKRNQRLKRPRSFQRLKGREIPWTGRKDWVQLSWWEWHQLFLFGFKIFNSWHREELRCPAAKIRRWRRSCVATSSLPEKIMAGAAESMVKTWWKRIHPAPARPYYKRDEKYNDLDAPTSNGFDNGVMAGVYPLQMDPNGHIIHIFIGNIEVIEDGSHDHSPHSFTKNLITLW